LALSTGRPSDAVYCFAVAGATMGFLRYNWSPARIYLGDAGSMTLGLVLGVMAIRISFKEATTVGLVVPVVIWAVLFFDVLMAMLRRRLTGQSIYATDRAHMHHVLQRHGYSAPGVVLIIGSACAACCLGVLAGRWLGNDLVPLAVSASVLALLVTSGLFGGSELRLFAQRLRHFLCSLIRFPLRRRQAPTPFVSRFHGDRAWEGLWEELVTYSERFNLSLVQLNVSAPSIGEEYHACWERCQVGNVRTQWKSEIPLVVGDLAVGRLVVSGGVSSDKSTMDWMMELMSGLKPLQIQMEALLLDTVTLQLPDHPARALVSQAQDAASSSHLEDTVIGPAVVVPSHDERYTNVGVGYNAHASYPETGEQRPQGRKHPLETTATDSVQASTAFATTIPRAVRHRSR
jgi:UDP-GlcNAc:undecaprenyl-phosphate/decaprenyl-phosphate GlcNAc-1-phosphate transferase